MWNQTFNSYYQQETSEYQDKLQSTLLLLRYSCNSIDRGKKLYEKNNLYLDSGQWTTLSLLSADHIVFRKLFKWFCYSMLIDLNSMNLIKSKNKNLDQNLPSYR